MSDSFIQDEYEIATGVFTVNFTVETKSEATGHVQSGPNDRGRDIVRDMNRATIFSAQIIDNHGNFGRNADADELLALKEQIEITINK